MFTQVYSTQEEINDDIASLGHPAITNPHIHTLVDYLKQHPDLKQINFELAYSEENLNYFNKKLEKKIFSERLSRAFNYSKGPALAPLVLVGIYALIALTVSMVAGGILPLSLLASATGIGLGTSFLVGTLGFALDYFTNKDEVIADLRDSFSKNITEQVADVIKNNKTLTQIDLTGWLKFNLTEPLHNQNNINNRDKKRIYQNLKIILNAKRYNPQLQITFDKELLKDPYFEKILNKINPPDFCKQLNSEIYLNSAINSERQNNVIQSAFDTMAIRRHFVRDQVKQAIKKEINREPATLFGWSFTNGNAKLQENALTELKKSLQLKHNNEENNIKTLVKNWGEKYKELMAKGRAFGIDGVCHGSSRKHFADTLLEIADQAEQDSIRFVI